MTDNDPIKSAKDGIALVGEIIKAAGDNPNVRQAGSELGQTALTLTKAINNVLLPLAAVNYAFEKARIYFAEDFQRDLAKKVDSIPPEYLVEPKPSIAGPALQGLAFSYEEVDLREMYLSLIAKAMDGRSANIAHPAFVEIIRQLSGEEAEYLRDILKQKSAVPIVEVRFTTEGNPGYQVIAKHLMGLNAGAPDFQPVENPMIPALLENWVRLGLVSFDYATFLTAEKAYEWVDARPEYIRLKAERETPKGKVSFQRGIVVRTAFGMQFADAVGISSDRA